MKTKWLPLILIVLLTLGFTACGKKGPPVPPTDEEERQETPNREYRGTRS